MTDIRILVIEDDLFSADMVWSLLVKDWRTEVIDEQVHSRKDVYRVLAKSSIQPDIVLLDTDVINLGRNVITSLEWTTNILGLVETLPNPPLIVCTCTKPDLQIFRFLLGKVICKGYLVKNEVGYAIPTAVCLAHAGNWVLTQGIYNFIGHMDFLNSAYPMALVQSRENIFRKILSRREWQIAKLFVIFNHSHSDIADELNISEGESRKIINKFYKRLKSEGWLDSFENLKAIAADPIMSRKMKKFKATNLKLAFYILTEPEVEIWE